MKIQDLAGKTICILGYGKEGNAMAEALEKYAPGCHITIADKNQELGIIPPTLLQSSGRAGNYESQLGEEWLKDLDRFDVLIKSPGIPPLPELTSSVLHLMSPTQIFFDSIADSGATVIGVTGSKGKSTTASLIHHIIANCQLLAGRSQPGSDEGWPIATSQLIGNIGEPAIAHIADAKKGTIFVMEMSSYQLVNLNTSPHIAVITSFFPEHLDYHGSLEAYKEAKSHICKFQTKDDFVFFAENSPGAATMALGSPGMRVPFSAKECPVTIEETHLIGTHNESNIAGAYKVALHLGADSKSAIAAIKSFMPLPHRLESIGVIHGIEWINDAISTTPESTIAALDALGSRVHTIILGGQDRGNDFTELGKRIAVSDIKNVILFPGSGPRIKQAIEKANANVTFFDANSMEAVVTIARKNTTPAATRGRDRRGAAGNSGPGVAPIVLLSTASPSYGMFKNFEEKGEMFRKEIRLNDSRAKAQ